MYIEMIFLLEQLTALLEYLYCVIKLERFEQERVPMCILYA